MSARAAAATPLLDLGLPALWQSQPHFTVLDTGFGTGLHFLQTWQQWLCEPGAPQGLTYVAWAGLATPADALTREALQQHLHTRDWPDASPQTRQTSKRMPALVAELLDAWPASARNVHVLDFEGGRVRLLAVFGPARQALTQLRLQADTAWVPDTSAVHKADDARHLAAVLARRLKVGALIRFEYAGSSWLKALQAEGFQRDRAPIASASAPVCHAVYRPTYLPRRMLREAGCLKTGAGDESSAVIIGGGLAGALTARALARAGWQCTVLDSHAEPASEASGNTAGLFHGSAHRGDGLHARFSRAAALLAAKLYGPWIGSGLVDGAMSGVLRARAESEVPKDLPQSFVKSLTPAQAQALSACAVDSPAWLYPQGGWISPRGVCRAALQTPNIAWLGNTRVNHLERVGEKWRVFDGRGTPVAEAPVIVCATGRSPPLFPGAAGMPTSAMRGQMSWLGAADAAACSSAPTLPMTGHGYALRLPDGALYFGASSADGDLETGLRQSDHDFNRERLAALCGIQLASDQPLHGRVGWRATLPDRLPLVGAWPVPAEDAESTSAWDQCRRVPRVPGLYVLMGMASRGLTWAPLAAEVIAAAITGRPQPLEADLLDAIDPARFAVRAIRKTSAVGKRPG